MTSGELAINLLEDYGDEASIEDFIDAIVIMVKRDRDLYVKDTLERTGRVMETDPVLACLDGAARSLEDAGLAMYASFK